MRLKFGMTETEKTVGTCTIVMELELEGKTIAIGALADSVQEVFDLSPEQIDPDPELGSRWNQEFIRV